MARPRKQAGQTDAGRRMMDSFWTLLETYTYPEITVSMIAGTAGCNRGSFYYHFSDVEDIATKAIERDCVRPDEVVERTYLMSTGGEREVAERLFGPEVMRKVSLAVQGGCHDLLGRAMRKSADDAWAAMSARHGEEVTRAHRAVNRFAIGGLLSMMITVSETPEAERDMDGLAAFLRDSTALFSQKVSAAQGVPQERLVERLHEGA